MRTFEIGFVLPTGDDFVEGPSPRWTEIRDSSAEIAERLGGFGAIGFTWLEVVLWPLTPAALNAVRPVLELLDAG